MAEIVNLNRVRKAKQRAAARVQGAENRALYGRTKTEQQKIEAERRRDAKELDAKKLETRRPDPE